MISDTAFLFRESLGWNSKDRRSREKSLAASEPVVLVPEPENVYDQNAVRVYSAKGHDLGYLRCTLAAVVSRRLSNGEKFAAYTAVVLGDEFYPDERINIRVEKVM